MYESGRVQYTSELRDITNMSPKLCYCSTLKCQTASRGRSVVLIDYNILYPLLWEVGSICLSISK